MQKLILGLYLRGKPHKEILWRWRVYIAEHYWVLMPPKY
jgi:hypothetical protein